LAGLDKKRLEKIKLDEPLEWETKTITSAIKAFFRNLPEPLMTFKMHNSFNAAASKSSTIPSFNFKMILVQIQLWVLKTQNPKPKK
jgi:hypothetical protein